MLLCLYHRAIFSSAPKGVDSPRKAIMKNNNIFILKSFQMGVGYSGVCVCVGGGFIGVLKNIHRWRIVLIFYKVEQLTN